MGNAADMRQRLNLLFSMSKSMQKSKKKIRTEDMLQEKWRQRSRVVSAPDLKSILVPGSNPALTTSCSTSSTSQLRL